MSASTPGNPGSLHPTARPGEHRRDIEFAGKDVQLRHDVHELGRLVGELLREQCGEELYAAVERARRAAIDRREGEASADGQIGAVLQGLDTHGMRDFARAFSTFFQMVNTAEQVHRIRRARDYQRRDSAPQPGSIRDTLFRLRDGGLDLDATGKLLGSLYIMPVFSSHPTAPTRRTILRKHQVIARHLVEMQNSELTPAELAAAIDAIRTEITTVWQTEEYPGDTRTVFDELEHALFFMTDVIYRVIPAFYEAIEHAVLEVHGAAIGALPPIIRFASWIGGDMDGNPEITARTIREVLARQRSLILDLYHRECRELANKLSQGSSRAGVDAAVHLRIHHYAGHFGRAMGAIPLRHRDMPYRVLLRLMMARLQATHDDGGYPYESPEEFLDDIGLIAQSLDNNRGGNAGLFAVRRLQRRVQTFGFHLMALDLKQGAPALRQVVGACLDDPYWSSRSAAERAERIRTAIRRNESPCETLDNDAKRALSVFQAVAFCRRKYGQRAIGPFIVSGSHDVDDLLSVLLLGRWGDLHGPAGSVPLDIVPLFETAADLRTAQATTARLLEDPIYREHLARREQRQVIMLGYSDSNKHEGLAAARWLLKQTQAELVRVMDAAGVAFTFFHGRGGAMTAGGGKTHAAVRVSPPGAVRGQLRAIDQGELVSTKYGFRGVALRTLEQATGSVALATALPERVPAAAGGEWHRLMEQLADSSRRHYQSLVKQAPGFLDYFRQATPVDLIERMHLHADAGEDVPGELERLRGVPWVSAWTQNRMMMPGWFGFGTGLDSLVREHGEERLREMLHGWHFFRVLLGDVELALAKADPGIAAHYSTLAGSLHERFFPPLQAEFELCTQRVLALLGHSVLLEDNDTLRRSIRLRNPYVDPLSLLQVELLRRWRAGGRQDPQLYEALVASINGITRGLQDSG